MFINLSNHDSARWGNEQRMAAAQYGDIVDIPFPAVPPDGTAAEVVALAQNYINKIFQQLSNAKQPSAVHVMGEMTFTFMVVTRLKELGIKCIASTTERKTTYNPDGTKVSEFQFVKFREY